ncbi:MAG: hypothetical protein AAB336_08390 [Acidobacteriota bacterium]
MQSIRNIRAEVVLAEDLTIRQLEADYKTSIIRQVKFESENIIVPLDGIIRVGENLFRGVEVKYITEVSVKKNVRNLLADISLLANRLSALNLPDNISLLVAIVGKDIKEDSFNLIRNQFNSLVKGMPISVELRFFDFEELQKRFGIKSET